MDIKQFKNFESVDMSDFISESDLDDYLLATSDKYTTKTYKGKYFIDGINSIHTHDDEYFNWDRGVEVYNCWLVVIEPKINQTFYYENLYGLESSLRDTPSTNAVDYNTMIEYSNVLNSLKSFVNRLKNDYNYEIDFIIDGYIYMIIKEDIKS